MVPGSGGVTNLAWPNGLGQWALSSLKLPRAGIPKRAVYESAGRPDGRHWRKQPRVRGMPPDPGCLFADCVLSVAPVGPQGCVAEIMLQGRVSWYSIKTAVKTKWIMKGFPNS